MASRGFDGRGRVVYRGILVAVFRYLSLRSNIALATSVIDIVLDKSLVE